MAFDLFQNLNTASSGHGNIEKDEIETLLHDLGKRFRTASRLVCNDNILLACQDLLDPLPDNGMIVCHKNFYHKKLLLFQCIGIRTSTVVPLRDFPIILTLPPHKLTLSRIPMMPNDLASLISCTVIPPTIIRDFQADIVALGGKAHLHLGCVCMADNIRKRFLKNTKQGCGQVLVDGAFLTVDADIAGNARPILEFLDLPFYRGRQSHDIVKQNGSQFRRNTMDTIDGRIDKTPHPLDLSRKKRICFRQIGLYSGKIHLKCREGLAQFIVDFPGNPLALLLPG